MKSRAELDAELDALAARAPSLRQEYPDAGDFAMAFAGLAELVEDSAGPADAAHVSQRIDQILDEHGTGLP